MSEEYVYLSQAEVLHNKNAGRFGKTWYKIYISKYQNHWIFLTVDVLSVEGEHKY